LISVFSGNIKFGSSGEYETNETNKNRPADNIRKPNISVNLLAIKRRVILTIFFMFISSESNLSLCII